MNTLALVGAQWGDEGKGKVIDILAEKADVVVRAQGGNNAGHTVVTGGVTYKLHLIPFLVVPITESPRASSLRPSSSI